MGSIRLEGVRKTFGNTVVIQGVDLDIEDGSFVVFVGPSGCGKSTLLRLIAGLEDVTAGRIIIDGKDVSSLAAAKRGLSMVFQSYALYPHMTVRKNIGFGLKMARRPREEIERKVAVASKILNLTDYLDRKPGELSGWFAARALWKSRKPVRCRLYRFAAHELRIGGARRSHGRGHDRRSSRAYRGEP